MIAFCIASVSGGAAAQEPSSATVAKELAAAMAERTLETIAVQDPNAPAGFVAAMVFPDVELGIETRIARMMDLQREGAVLDNQVARLQLHLVVGAKPEVVVLAFRRRVDPAPLVAAEWGAPRCCR